MAIYEQSPNKGTWVAVPDRAQHVARPMVARAIPQAPKQPMATLAFGVSTPDGTVGMASLTFPISPLAATFLLAILLGGMVYVGLRG